MTEQILRYKDFSGSVEFSSEDQCLFGKILDIDALIMYSADSVAEITKAFHSAVDEYLLDCEQQGQEPQKPYKGSFNVRIGSELHRRAASVARARGQRLNELVKRAIAYEVERETLHPRKVEITLSAQTVGVLTSAWSEGHDPTVHSFYLEDFSLPIRQQEYIGAPSLEGPVQLAKKARYEH